MIYITQTTQQKLFYEFNCYILCIRKYILIFKKCKCKFTQNKRRNFLTLGRYKKKNTNSIQHTKFNLNNISQT